MDRIQFFFVQQSGIEASKRLGNQGFPALRPSSVRVVRFVGMEARFQKTHAIPGTEEIRFWKRARRNISFRCQIGGMKGFFGGFRDYQGIIGVFHGFK